MFGILKNLFRKEQETVKADELHAWLANKISTLENDLLEQLSEMNKRVQSGVEATKTKLAALEQASLMNADIPERAKHFMKGNKEEYNRRVTQFLEALFAPTELAQFEQFKVGMQKNFQELLEGTARPLKILNEFLANETRETHQALSLIESAIARFDESLKNSTYTELVALRDALQRAEEGKQQHATLKKELAEARHTVDELEAVNKKLREEVALLNQAKELKDLRQEKDRLAEQKKVLEQSLHQTFSTVETALRKYSHIAMNHKKLCESYLTDPVAALTQDLHLNILTLLYDMKKAIERNVLDLKEKKKSKTLDELSELNKESLGTFLAEYGRITKEQKALDDQIKQSDITTLIKIKNDKIIENTDAGIQEQTRIKKIQRELQKTQDADPKKQIQHIEKLANIKVV